MAPVPVRPRSAHRSDRRLRLRRRRPHRPARAARRAAAGGLPVPRRLGALSRTATARPRSCEPSAGRSPTRCSSAARSSSSSPATRRRRARWPTLDGARRRRRLGRRRHRRRRPGVQPRRRADAQRAHRRARDAGDGRQRRLRARGARGRPARAPDERRLPAARADLAGRRADHRGRRGARPRATARRCATAQVDTVILGCTHYPFVGSLLQRLLGPQVTLDHVRHRDRAPRRSTRSTRRDLAHAERPARALQLPVHRRRRGVRARSARASCSCRWARSTTSTAVRSRYPHDDRRRPRPLLRPRARRPAPDDDRAGLRQAGGRLGAHHPGRDARDLHGVGAGERAALDGRPGRGWVTAEYGMLPASTGDRKAARHLQGQARRAQRRDPAPDRPLDPRRRSTSRRSASARSTSTATCSPPTAARAARRSPAPSSRSTSPSAALLAEGKLERSPLTGSVAAISCGIVGGVPLLDLDYSEDSTAEVDANVVMTGEGGLDRGPGDRRAHAAVARAPRRPARARRRRHRAAARACRRRPWS